MNFQTASKLSNIDYALNNAVNELYNHITDKNSDFTLKEREILTEAYQVFCNALEHITNNIQY